MFVSWLQRYSRFLQTILFMISIQNVTTMSLGNDSNLVDETDTNSTKKHSVKLNFFNGLSVTQIAEITSALYKDPVDFDIKETSLDEVLGYLNTESNVQEDGKSLMLRVFDLSQLVIVSIGLFANGMTVITLVKNGESFSPAILTLLRHQSVVDGMTCAAGIILLSQSFDELSGNPFIDIIICHLWYSQIFYWFLMILSVWNLVAIAYERYMAVCHPFKHRDLTKKKIRLIIGLCYLSSLIPVVGFSLQFRIEGTRCVYEHYFKGTAGQFFKIVVPIYGFLYVYLIPTVLFFMLYGMIIITFQRRKNEGEFTHSKTIHKASKNLTKTACVVTCIFIVVVGYDLWYYILGFLGAVEYIMNTPIQKIGVWLSAFNSVVNPFIYALLMPAYRKSIQDTFLKPCTTTPDDTIGKPTLYME